MPDLQYAGYYFHSPSKLSLNLRRSYNSGLARWLNRDPLGEVAGNLYAYAGADPILYVDPSGLAWQFFICFRSVVGEVITAA